MNTNTRQRLINPLEPIVPWITHKIQTILVFLIMIYECELYLRNSQLHLCALISLLCATLSTLFQGIPIISTVHSNTSFKMTTYRLSRSARVYIAVCEGKEKEQVMIFIIKKNNLIRTHFVNTNTRQRLNNPLDPIVPWITHKIQTILVFLIMIYECEFYFRNPQLHLCSDLFIACYSFCATLSTLVNGIPIISTVHSNTSFKMTTYVLCKSLHRSMCRERERTSDDYHYQTTNLIRTYFVNTNTRQRLINPLDPIVPWITHKIQTILVFLIMIYECELYLRNSQLHLCALISLLCATLSTLVKGIPIISTVHSNTSFKMTTYRLSRSARVYIAVCEGKEKEQVMIIIIKPPT